MLPNPLKKKGTKIFPTNFQDEKSRDIGKKQHQSIKNCMAPNPKRTPFSQLLIEELLDKGVL